MATELFRWTDGAASVIVERLALGEVGIRTEVGGVILSDEAAADLAEVIRVAADGSRFHG